MVSLDRKEEGRSSGSKQSMLATRVSETLTKTGVVSPPHTRFVNHFGLVDHMARERPEERMKSKVLLFIKP